MSHTLDSLRYSTYTGASVFGRPVPPNVGRTHWQHDHITGEYVVQWLSHDGTGHSLRIPEVPSDEDINAVIMAMRLSQ